MKYPLLILTVLLVACSPGTYNVTYNGTPATCTVAKGVATDYDVVCATATPEPTATPGPVVYFNDFDYASAYNPGGWEYFMEGSTGVASWSYPVAQANNGIVRLDFGGAYTKLKVDSNHCCGPDGLGRISIPLLVYVDGTASGGPNIAPVDLRNATITTRIRGIVQRPAQTVFGYWAQGCCNSAGKAYNLFVAVPGLNAAINDGQWREVSVSPAMSDWVCLGWRPGMEYYYGCPDTMEQGLSNITRNMGFTFFNVDSTWNAGDPGSYDAQLENIPEGWLEWDWWELR